MLIAANWKLNPSSLTEAEMLTGGIKVPESGDIEVLILPPFVFLEELAKKFPQFSWGAQDFFFQDTGAFTGEVSLPMLKSVGANYVLVGHSDRRQKFGETDEIVNKKLLAALEDGFKVILAVGELEKGDNLEPVINSLKASTKNIKPKYLNQLSIAYEPIWAISTTEGVEDETPEHASSVIEELKKVLDVRYLYGGSVDSENAKGFLSKENIEGALIGGASLKPEEFSKILEVV